jgi:hypothetical protein
MTREEWTSVSEYCAPHPCPPIPPPCRAPAPRPLSQNKTKRMPARLLLRAQCQAHWHFLDRRSLVGSRDLPRVTSVFLVSAPLPLSLALSRVRSLCARARALSCLSFLLPVPSCAGPKQRRQDLPKRLLRAHPLARAAPLPLLMYHDEERKRRGAAVSCMKAGDVRGVGALKPQGEGEMKESRGPLLAGALQGCVGRPACVCSVSCL